MISVLEEELSDALQVEENLIWAQLGFTEKAIDEDYGDFLDLLVEIFGSDEDFHLEWVPFGLGGSH